MTARTNGTGWNDQAQRRTRAGRSVLAGFSVVLLTLLLCVTGAAAQDATKTDPPRDPLAKELETVRRMLTNAQMKLNRHAVGVDARDSGARSTPARRCCSDNLGHIDESLQAIRKLVRERGVCYERQRDREGVEIVNLVNQDLRALTNAVTLFDEATQPADTQSALDGCTRAFLNLMRSTAALKDCPAGP